MFLDNSDRLELGFEMQLTSTWRSDCIFISILKSGLSEALFSNKEIFIFLLVLKVEISGMIFLSSSKVTDGM